MTVETRVISSVDVGAEISPDDAIIGHLLGAVVRAAAVAIVAGGRFATVLQLEVGAAGLTVDEDRRLVLDRFAISKFGVYELIEHRLLNITSVCLKVEPIGADILSARVVGILDGGERDCTCIL